MKNNVYAYLLLFTNVSQETVAHIVYHWLLLTMIH